MRASALLARTAYAQVSAHRLVALLAALHRLRKLVLGFRDLAHQGLILPQQALDFTRCDQRRRLP